MRNHSPTRGVWLRRLLRAPSDRVVSLLLFVALIVAIAANPRIIDRPIHAQALSGQLVLGSLAYSGCFWGKRFPVVALQDAVAGGRVATSFHKPSLVVLFSTSDCGDCVRHELSLVEKLRSGSNLPLPVVAIGAGKSSYKLLAFRKVSHARYPFLFDSDGVCADSLGVERLPLVALVGEANRIVCAYSPIPGLSEYSAALAQGMANLAVGLRNASSKR